MDVEHLFRAHHESLFRYLARHCGDAEQARDAVQETFLRLHASPPATENGARAWLFRTGMNVIRDEARVSGNRRRLLEARAHAVPTPRPPTPPDDALELESERARLRAALGSLRDRERTAILMREEGFKHREIAAALGTTTGTVGTLLARTLEKLAVAMSVEGEGR